MSFFKKTWVVVVAVICAIISIGLFTQTAIAPFIVLFALHGFTQTDIAPFIDAIWAVVDVFGILLLASCNKKAFAEERYCWEVDFFTLSDFLRSKKNNRLTMMERGC